MPSKSPEQARTMRAIAHGWKPPASSGIDIPVSVAKDFAAADQNQALRLAQHLRNDAARSKR